MSAVGLDREVRGYVKQYSGVFRAGGVDWLSLTRSRVKLRWFPGVPVTVAVDYEFTLWAGSGGPLTGLGEAPAQQFVDLTWTVVDENRVFAEHTLDRLYAEYYAANMVITAGRQRVGWGVSSYFRPLDQFAPFAPAQVDKEERAGIDALRASFPLGRLSNVEVVYNPYRDFEAQRFGVRGRTNIGRWDLGGVAGVFDTGESVGASAAGSAGGAGLRAEALVTRSDGHRWVVWGGSGLDTLRIGKVYLRATVGAEYGFGWRNLTVGGEVYFDGSGRTGEVEYDRGALLSGRRITLAKHYAAASVSLLASPLLTLSGAAILNMDDGSSVLQPRAAYSVKQTLDMTAGAQFFLGENLTEYGVLPDFYFLNFAWYF